MNTNMNIKINTMATKTMVAMAMAATSTLRMLMLAHGGGGVDAFQTSTSQHNHSQRLSVDTPLPLPLPFRLESMAPMNPSSEKWPLSSTTASSSDLDLDLNNTKNLKLEQKTWMFQDKYPIAYEVATTNLETSAHESDVDVEVVPILLLNGFGVGSFHQHRLMRQLLLLEDDKGEQSNNNNNQKKKKKKKYVIYGIDYLGQGKSWPTNCNDGNSSDELNLGYSADTWLDQLTGFIEQIVVPSSSNNKVHLVGNSVGGYLSTILSHRHPHLISSLVLMNATPVWGLNLPGWDGKLPAPSFPKLVGRKLFDTIRDLGVIDKYLEAAYVHRDAYDGTYADNFYYGFNDNDDDDDVVGNDDNINENNALGPKIRGCTEGNGGHAAFASILWSAPASAKVAGENKNMDPATTPTPADFYGTLKNLSVDVLLLFGEDDPWCTPAVAKRMHATLAGRGVDGVEQAHGPTQRYVSLEGVGHCPNHEAPTAVARVLSHWIEASSSSEQSLAADDDDSIQCCRGDVSLVSGSAEIVNESWGPVSAREVSIEESQNLGVIDKIVSSMVG